MKYLSDQKLWQATFTFWGDKYFSKNFQGRKRRKTNWIWCGIIFLKNPLFEGILFFGNFLVFLKIFYKSQKYFHKNSLLFSKIIFYHNYCYKISGLLVLHEYPFLVIMGIFLDLFLFYFHYNYTMQQYAIVT